jgi:hypothetical protein
MRNELPIPNLKKSMRQLVEKVVESSEEDVLFANGFDEAILGLSLDNPKEGLRVIYDYSKCISILEERDGMTLEEAEEFFSFNVVGAWVGEGTPLYVLTKDFLEEEVEEYL